MTNLDPDARRDALAPYQRPDHRRSVLELLATVVPLALLWALCLYCVSRHWWWGLGLTIPAAAFLVRLFMIQHDCGHQAFFRAGAANAWVGRLIGVLTMTPYDYWRRTHAIHHATSGNLDRRSLGAIETFTVAEYRALPKHQRLAYRFYRHPLVMLGVGPPYMFILQHRLPIGLMRDARAWRSVMGNNLGIVLTAVPLALLIGPVDFLMVHVPIMALAASIGVWLFYVQHQFEGAYWARNPAWSLHDAAVRGSSNLHLPPPLRWLTANIGAHHAHHAASKVPFYRLPEMLRDLPQFGEAPRKGLRDGFKALSLTLWDEDGGRLVSFREAARGGGSRVPLAAE